MRTHHSHDDSFDSDYVWSVWRGRDLFQKDEARRLYVVNSLYYNYNALEWRIQYTLDRGGLSG